MRHEWRESLSSDEERAMIELGIDPGFNDYSADDVLRAYRSGKQIGALEILNPDD